jgi:hypothetical protein
MSEAKKQLEFNRERHRYVKDFLKVYRALRILESWGLIESRLNPAGVLMWRATKQGLSMTNWNVH